MSETNKANHSALPTATERPNMGKLKNASAMTSATTREMPPAFGTDVLSKTKRTSRVSMGSSDRIDIIIVSKP